MSKAEPLRTPSPSRGTSTDCAVAETEPIGLQGFKSTPRTGRETIGLPDWHVGSFHGLAAMQLINAPLPVPDLRLPEVALSVDRITVAKRLWRSSAEDGTEFGFELERPLRHGDVFWQTPTTRYVIQQKPEAVVEIALDIAPSAAAGIGWAIGNLHLELSAEVNRLLALDEPAVRQLLDRLKVPYKPTTAIFRSGRFVRGEQPSHELGQSHRH